MGREGSRHRRSSRWRVKNEGAVDPHGRRPDAPAIPGKQMQTIDNTDTDVPAIGANHLEWLDSLRDRGLFTNKTDDQIVGVLELVVRPGFRDHPADPTTHAYGLKRLKDWTGLSAKQIALPPPVDPQQRAAMDARRRRFEEGDPELVDPDDGQDTARRFLRSTEDDLGWPEMVRQDGEFYRYTGTHYTPMAEEEVSALIYRFLTGKVHVNTGKPIKPERALVDRVLHAARAGALIDVEAPAWIGPSSGAIRPQDVIAFRNGLLDIDSRKLMRHTRRFFGLNARAYDYRAKAPEPRQWVEFLRQVFGDDTESTETLAEVFGLLLTPDTSLQKAFLIVGPPRSGKGTVLRILRELLGADNVAAPTLAGLGGQFGLQTLIGKLAALISDARLGGRADIQAITENILRVTGEDAVSIPRKFLTDWTSRLSVRFVIVSNEIPAFLDQSGALANRFVLLTLANSFLGREDPGLTDRLLTELPGIALWALDGLDRLRERGYFRQPASAREAVRQLHTLSSPIKAFIEDCCVVAPGASVECNALYLAWMQWCTEHGREQAGTVQIFGRNLSAAVPGVRVTRPRTGDGRERRYEGLGLKAGP